MPEEQKDHPHAEEPLTPRSRELSASDLLPKVYEQLRGLAAARLHEMAPGQTLQPTALVHEAYLRLTEKGDPGWETPGHFFAAAAIAMRWVLVDHARARLADKRGSGARKLSLEDSPDLAFDSSCEDILALDELVETMGRQHPRQARLVMFKYFGGLTDAQSAEALGVTERTVSRDWRLARAWLLLHWQGREDHAA
jgi:RNA polymerase sigma factor (TIGR02999 family)